MAIPTAALLCAGRAPLTGYSDVRPAIGHAQGGGQTEARLARTGADSVQIVADAAAARRAHRAPRAGFGIQYWGENYTAEGLAAAPHCALIVEASIRGADMAPDFREGLFTADDVARIRRGGARPAYAYLNVGEVVPYRDYWVTAFGTDVANSGGTDSLGDGAPAWYGGSSAAGERLAAFWTPEWEAVLRQRIDAFLARGYDGVFLDDVLHYYTWSDSALTMPAQLAARGGAPRKPADFAKSMISLVVRLSDYARQDAPLANPDFTMIVNGGIFIGWDASSGEAAPTAQHPMFEAYISGIDAIAIESALGERMQPATIDALQQSFAARGVAVLTIDYGSLHPGASSDAFRDQIRRQAQSLGFLPYVATDARFARLDPPLLADTHLAATALAASCDRPASGAGDGAKGPQ